MLLTKASITGLAKCHHLSEREILILLGFITDKDYTSLFFGDNFQLTEVEFQRLLEYIERRTQGEPISKIIQRKEFYGITFKTCGDTLDPRPETELIVDLFMKYFSDKAGHYEILDLGAGTGCIGLSILKHYEAARCLFVDIDTKALNMAQYNASALSLDHRSSFQESDWFTAISGEYDAIVANPPYIAADYDLPREVLFDPRIALVAGGNGMAAHLAILSNAHLFLKKNGRLFLEIGYDQRAKIEALNNSLEIMEIAQDINGIDRALVFLRNLW
ncbi:MAG: peptide chain release factor N(5)-glutamine methyltransferase [Holosporales bacterium]|jgi:release factor glutamine methyltransferase|nr:peptide chain release factor N(5)-glutamine methyltransferase [Holosporales bacterium]